MTNISQEMIDAGFVCRDPCEIDKYSPEYLRKKRAIAEEICKRSITIQLHLDRIEKEIGRDEKDSR